MSITRQDEVLNIGFACGGGDITGGGSNITVGEGGIRRLGGGRACECGGGWQVVDTVRVRV